MTPAKLMKLVVAGRAKVVGKDSRRCLIYEVIEPEPKRKTKRA